MIKQGAKSITSRMKGSKAIQYIYKGALLVYQAMKKFLVSGVFPLTLENTVGSDLTNYKIDGNTYSTLADDTNNIFSSYGVSARDITSATGQRILSNNYGTTINSIDYTGEIVATQKKAPNTSSVISYENGFFCLGLNGLEVGKTYTLFYNFEVLDNPLNVKNTDVAMINGTNGIYATYSGNLAKHTFVWDKYTGYESREYIELRLCGRSMKYSNFAIFEGEIQDFPVVSIESVGTKTINLFNPANWEGLTTSNTGITVQYLKDEDCFLLNGTATTTSRFAEKYINLPIIKGSVFSITTEYVSGSIYRKASNEYAVAYFGAYDSIDNRTNWISTNLYDYDNKSENIVCNYNYITALWFYVSEGVRFDNYKVKIQLQEGKTATKYEPYGYKIPITTRGKNLLPFPYRESRIEGQGTIIEAQEDGGIKFSGTATGYNALTLYNGPVLGHGKVTLSAQGTFKHACLQILVTEGNTILFNRDRMTTSVTINLDDYPTADRMLITAKRDVDDVLSGVIYPQLELGDVATEYELYKKPTITDVYIGEPLRKFGDIVDYVDFANKKIVRKTKELVLNEYSAPRLYPYNGMNGITIPHIMGDSYKRQVGICTHTTKIGEFFDSNSLWLGVDSAHIYWIGILDILGLTTADEFKAWLKDNNVKIIFPLNTPIEETVYLPSIPTLEDTTILDSDVAVQPSYVEVEYTDKKTNSTSFVMADGNTLHDANGDIFILKEG